MEYKDKKQKVLIVDDTPEYIDVLMGLLRNDYKLVPARNGEAALKLALSENPPDLILLDIMMPEMDGYEVCKRLKDNEATRDIPIIFLTAKDEESDEKLGFEMGAVDYITKPIQPAIVKARVKTHLALKQTRQELEEKNDELQESLATQNKFFSIIAHDLKSPIAGFLSFADILLNTDTIDKNLQEIAQLIKASGETLSKLLENLLNWARIKMGQMEFEPETLPLASVITANIELMALLAKNKGINLSSDIDEQIKVNADSNMLNTIIRNLISNAIKFTNSGDSVTISSQVSESVVNVSITDTGIGIPDSEIEKLFKIDVTTTRSGTQNETGTGLGLILCKELIEKNSGEITVSSKEGEGSTFTVSVPKSQ